MKKFILLLAVAGMFAVTACNSGTKTETTSTDTTVTTSTSVDSTVTTTPADTTQK